MLQNAGASITDCLSAAALVPFLLLGLSPAIPGQAAILLHDFSIPMALAGLIALIHMGFLLFRL